MKTLLVLVLLPCMVFAQSISYNNRVVQIGDVYEYIGDYKLDSKSYYVYVYTETCPAVARYHKLLSESTKDSLEVIAICIDPTKTKDLKWRTVQCTNFTTTMTPCGFVIKDHCVVKTNYFYY